MLNKAGASIGWGAVVMLLTPIIAILLLITVIGIPLAAILIGLWFIALLISKVLVGITIGRLLLRKNKEPENKKEEKKNSLMLPMVIGITLSWLIFSAPVIGWLLSLVALWWGLGGIWLQFRKA